MPASRSLSQVTEASKISYDEGELGLQTELKLKLADFKIGNVS